VRFTRATPRPCCTGGITFCVWGRLQSVPLPRTAELPPRRPERRRRQKMANVRSKSSGLIQANPLRQDRKSADPATIRHMTLTRLIPTVPASKKAISSPLSIRPLNGRCPDHRLNSRTSITRWSKSSRKSRQRREAYGRTPPGRRRSDEAELETGEGSGCSARSIGYRAKPRQKVRATGSPA